MTLDPKYYLQLSASSGVPIYRQIIDQVKIHIASGRLKPGDFLPSVRQVAKEMEVNPMTVSKAYSLLEKDGVLESAPGQGMLVKESRVSRQDLKERDKEILPLLKELLVKARQLSLDKQRLADLIDKVWKEE